jgi:hypothetical protein
VLVLLMVGIYEGAVEMGSHGRIYVPSSRTNGKGISVILRNNKRGLDFGNSDRRDC